MKIPFLLLFFLFSRIHHAGERKEGSFFLIRVRIWVDDGGFLVAGIRTDLEEGMILESWIRRYSYIWKGRRGRPIENRDVSSA